MPELIQTKPVVNDWFTVTVDYSGGGRAEFSDPPGIIEGPTRVQFDERGNACVDMKVERMEPACDDPLRALLFLQGSPPGVKDGTVSYCYSGGMENPCVRLVVMSENGVFSAAAPPLSGLKSSLIHQGIEQLSFRALRSSWDVIEAQAPQYWVLPLTNFVSEFGMGVDSLAGHPLRIHRPPTIPANLPGPKAILAQWVARSATPLIPFEFNGALGFIEPLPDYKERQAKLVQGQERQLATALMVGNVAGHKIDFPALESWFPFDFLSLLSLATGSEVSTPWIEFRDTAGKLVSRKHMRALTPAYTKGFRPIKGDIHDGIGRLLTCAPESQHWDKVYLRVAMNHLVRSNLSGLSIEDSLDHLCRGLDALCEEFGLKKGLTLESELDEGRWRALKKMLTEALRGVRTLASEAGTQGVAREEQALTRVADRIGKSTKTEIGFGKAVVALLEKFGFPDAEIMARYYALNPRKDGRSWPEVISRYRGTSIHRGYLDFRGGGADLDDVIAVYKHLHDILLRILFKLLGYDGTYQPTVVVLTTTSRPDWVTTETQANELGYPVESGGTVPNAVPHLGRKP